MHTNDYTIHKAKVISVKRISQHTYHLRVQSDDFAAMDYIPGYTINFFIGDPAIPGTPDRKYSIWNYEPVQNIADLAISTFSNGPGAQWIQSLQKDSVIYYKTPKGKLLLDDSADYYFMIGDVTSLSHLYEINRNLPVSKQVYSFIYSNDKDDVYADIDGSYPLDYHIFNSGDIVHIKNELLTSLPDVTGNGLAYVLGSPQACMEIQAFLRNEKGWKPSKLKTKAFWK